ncbi:GH25 family lysozyme [Rhodoblastus sp.]|jgi:lysozyme|uniref:glycoside hydrolase family 25 protein n=1 Tax=Rhodoblastus sp. TaxID=1962975 RepID=UPI00261049A0|nr:GH25 family lysozyme [Rhodoblastus sp.]
MRDFYLKIISRLALPGLLLAPAACGAGPDVLPGKPLVGARPGHYKETEATELARAFTIHGVDVSKYQGNVDWNAVQQGGVKFAYIKATEGGDRIDPKFVQNWQGAKSAGLPHGAYHFVYWCRPWNENMAWFEKNVPAERDALPPVLDVEATPDSPTCPRHLERDSALREIKAMLTEMERYYGKKPVIYTTVDFYQAIIDGSLTEYPIWIRSTKHRPSVKYGDRAWRFWQYQSDAYVQGIPTKVDRNAFYGDEKDWQNFLKSNVGAVN